MVISQGGLQDLKSNEYENRDEKAMFQDKDATCRAWSLRRRRRGGQEQAKQQNDTDKYSGCCVARFIF